MFRSFNWFWSKLSFLFHSNLMAFPVFWFIYFFPTETAKWTIWIRKNLNSVHFCLMAGQAQSLPAYANGAAYRLVGSLVTSPSRPTSIIHSCRTLSSSSSSPHPFLHPQPHLICRQTLRCCRWQANGEVGCEPAAEWRASPVQRD